MSSDIWQALVAGRLQILEPDSGVWKAGGAPRDRRTVSS
jgi:hypothetical protein